jgi:hypothetical protein
MMMVLSLFVYTHHRSNLQSERFPVQCEIQKFNRTQWAGAQVRDNSIAHPPLVCNYFKHQASPGGISLFQAFRSP